MSTLQEQAVQMINNMSDDNVSFLIEIINRLTLQKSYSEVNGVNNEESMQAFQRLDKARKEVHQYIPKDFDPDKELEKARVERYGSFN